MDDMGLSLFVFMSISAMDRRVPSSFMAAASKLPYRRLLRPTGGITQAVWAGCPAFVAVVVTAGMDAEVDVESHEDVVVVVIVVVLVDIAVVVLMLFSNSLLSFSPLISPFPFKSAFFFLPSSCCPSCVCFCSSSSF